MSSDIVTSAAGKLEPQREDLELALPPAEVHILLPDVQHSILLLRWGRDQTHQIGTVLEREMERGVTRGTMDLCEERRGESRSAGSSAILEGTQEKRIGCVSFYPETSGAT